MIERNTPRLSRRRVGLETLDCIEPGARSRSEVEDEAGMPHEPGLHFRMFVGTVVVEDDMHDLSNRRLGFDRVEKTKELLMAMAPHAAADHFALDNVESSKQRCGAVPLIIVRHHR